MMAISGNSFIVELKEPHLKWGEYDPSRRGTPGIGRDAMYGEGYIQIPIRDAKRLVIVNSNDSFGRNTIYQCASYDGYFNGTLKAQGCASAGEIYAKQFAGDGNLKAIGEWYKHIGATAGDFVKVTFTSPDSIIIEHSTSRTGFHI